MGESCTKGSPYKGFYVEGLDLMEGRYGMVSNNLPHQSVAAVELLVTTNHSGF